MEEQIARFNNLLDENTRLRDLMKKQYEAFGSILDVFDSMEHSADIDGLTSIFVNKLPAIVGARKASFMLVDEVKEELFIKASFGLDPRLLESRAKLGDGFSGQVVKEGKPMLVKNVDTEFPRFSGKNRLANYSTKSFIIVPVVVEGKNIGVVSLTDRKEQEIFTDKELNIAELTVRYLGGRIEIFRLKDKIKNLSNFDPLTLLFSHRYFYDQLHEEIYRAERYHHRLSLLAVDIDNFTEYNKNFGYTAGDNILVQIAEIIKSNTRFTDIVSRFGPEEFIIMLPEAPLNKALLVAEKIREKISNSVFTDSADRSSALGMVKLTASVGAAEHKIGLSREELIRRIEQALTDAKESGKNKVCVFKGK